MADRKQFLGVTKANEDIVRLLKESCSRIVNHDELCEQRISFAFGNSLNSEIITKDSVRNASKSILLWPAQAKGRR